jgi:O-methyltransferase involved in polyketide biosynthesis
MSAELGASNRIGGYARGIIIRGAGYKTGAYRFDETVTNLR